VEREPSFQHTAGELSPEHYITYSKPCTLHTDYVIQNKNGIVPLTNTFAIQVAGQHKFYAHVISWDTQQKWHCCSNKDLCHTSCRSM